MDARTPACLATLALLVAASASAPATAKLTALSNDPDECPDFYLLEPYTLQPGEDVLRVSLEGIIWLWVAKDATHAPLVGRDASTEGWRIGFDAVCQVLAYLFACSQVEDMGLDARFPCPTESLVPVANAAARVPSSFGMGLGLTAVHF